MDEREIYNKVREYCKGTHIPVFSSRQLVPGGTPSEADKLVTINCPPKKEGVLFTMSTLKSRKGNNDG